MYIRIIECITNNIKHSSLLKTGFLSVLVVLIITAVYVFFSPKVLNDGLELQDKKCEELYAEKKYSEAYECLKKRNEALKKKYY